MVKAKVREYVKVAEAAEILGVSQGTVRAWAEAGKIPMHKNPANGYRLFRRQDLEKFLAKIASPQTAKKLNDSIE
jgi:excisionase family DNA binding protein